MNLLFQEIEHTLSDCIQLRKDRNISSGIGKCMWLGSGLKSLVNEGSLLHKNFLDAEIEK